MANFSRLQSRIEQLEAKREGDQYPEWCKKPGGTQGFLMLVMEGKSMQNRVSQASDPAWFRPQKPTEAAYAEGDKLCLAMLNSGSYAAAQMIALAEKKKWPRYREHPSDNKPDGPGGFQFTPRDNEMDKP